MASQQTILTAAGLDKLKAELEDLKSNKRPQVISRIEEAVSYGDLSENSEYDDAKNEQGFVEGRIAELEEMLNTAQIVQSNDGDHGKVTLGTTVSVKHHGATSKFTIVGAAEADPTEGLISNESPLGQALIGLKVGDTAVAETPKGETKYEIVSIGAK